MQTSFTNCIMKTLKGKIIDILYIVDYIDIYLDMYQDFITASLTITDASAFMTNNNISGGEEVVIQFNDGKGNPPVRLSMFVHQIDEPTVISYTALSYTVHLISSEYFASSTGTEECGRYDMPAHKIIHSILENLNKKSCATVPLKFKSKSVSPKFSDYSNTKKPFDLIRTITHTIHDASLSPWITYQDLYGYNFLPMKDVMAQQTYASVVLQNRTNHSFFGKNLVALDWWKDTSDNSLVGNSNQKPGEERYNLSLLNKTFEKSTFDGKKRFSDIPSLEKNSHLRGSVTYDKNISSYISDDPLHVETSAVRNSMFRSLSDLVYYVSLPIDTRIFGSVVDLDIPSKESTSKGFMSNKSEKGKFLCTSAKIHLGNLPHEFTILCEMSKNSRAVSM